MKDNILTLFKGMIVGSTMLVPGVSGGSMAMILGIYDKLVSSVSSFTKHMKSSVFFLGLFSIGGALGMLLFANPLSHLIDKYPLPMLYFFIGAVGGGVPLIVKQSQVKGFSWKAAIYVGIGFLIILGFSILPTGSFSSSMEVSVMSFLLLMVAGFVAAIALVLPGISVSYMLLIMGLYDETMRAITEFYFPFLIPLGIGVVLGIVLTTKTLEKLMNNYPQATYLIILGFIFGSILEIFPGIPEGFDIVVCGFALVCGYGIIRFISRGESVKHN